jgi:hypothetical protein
MDPRFDIAARLAALEGRLARIEAQGAGADEDSTLDTAGAARFLGYSVHGLYKLLERDHELGKCYFRAPGKRSRMRFSRQALERYKAART